MKNKNIVLFVLLLVLIAFGVWFYKKSTKPEAVPKNPVVTNSTNTSDNKDTTSSVPENVTNNKLKGESGDIVNATFYTLYGKNMVMLKWSDSSKGPFVMDQIEAWAKGAEYKDTEGNVYRQDGDNGVLTIKDGKAVKYTVTN